MAQTAATCAADRRCCVLLAAFVVTRGVIRPTARSSPLGGHGAPSFLEVAKSPAVALRPVIGQPSVHFLAEASGIRRRQEVTAVLERQWREGESTHRATGNGCCLESGPEGRRPPLLVVRSVHQWAGEVPQRFLDGVAVVGAALVHLGIFPSLCLNPSRAAVVEDPSFGARKEDHEKSPRHGEGAHQVGQRREEEHAVRVDAPLLRGGHRADGCRGARKVLGQREAKTLRERPDCGCHGHGVDVRSDSYSGQGLLRVDGHVVALLIHVRVDDDLTIRQRNQRLDQLAILRQSLRLRGRGDFDLLQHGVRNRDTLLGQC
eukprot:scaffold645_cov247-Pinguiococcus_pyrenoidosus.AAC.34